ncbi:hypothetical protein F511_44384 [Dorcoceras hygrometricum]|uniref:Uncharacterized protein n=1 Tax=Dorcoceras hygrometricum TaxID=472368 RepID=A0A2Z7C0I5_9LAMI|nr:hypothetical protein F511_44384 [Dorcoceras hygrometricum]
MKFRGDDEVCVAKSPAAEFASPNVQLLNVASLTLCILRLVGQSWVEVNAGQRSCACDWKIDLGTNRRVGRQRRLS